MDFLFYYCWMNSARTIFYQQCLFRDLYFRDLMLLLSFLFIVLDSPSAILFQCSRGAFLHCVIVANYCVSIFTSLTKLGGIKLDGHLPLCSPRLRSYSARLSVYLCLYCVCSSHLEHCERLKLTCNSAIHTCT